MWLGALSNALLKIHYKDEIEKQMVGFQSTQKPRVAIRNIIVHSYLFIHSECDMLAISRFPVYQRTGLSTLLNPGSFRSSQ